jgi:hypothetical protein
MQPIRIRVAGVAILSFLGACSSVPEARTPEQKRYLAEAGSSPLKFSVELSDLDAAVDRALGWLATYHSLKRTEADQRVFMELLRSFNRGVIASPMTYRVANLGSHGYAVDFVVKGGSVVVAVSHEHEVGFGLGEVVAHRAHLLAYYIKTGQLMPELLEE